MNKWRVYGFQKLFCIALKDMVVHGGRVGNGFTLCRSFHGLKEANKLAKSIVPSRMSSTMDLSLLHPTFSWRWPWTNGECMDFRSYSALR